MRIARAQYAGKFHCPPARAVVVTSPSGLDGSWGDVRTIHPQEIPRDGEPYDEDREWRYALPAGTSARAVPF